MATFDQQRHRAPPAVDGPIEVTFDRFHISDVDIVLVISSCVKPISTRSTREVDKYLPIRLGTDFRKLLSALCVQTLRPLHLSHVSTVVACSCRSTCEVDRLSS